MAKVSWRKPDWDMPKTILTYGGVEIGCVKHHDAAPGQRYGWCWHTFADASLTIGMSSSALYESIDDARRALVRFALGR